MERHRSEGRRSRGHPRATVLALVAALSTTLVLAVNASGAPSQTVTLKLLAQSTGAGGNPQMQAVIDKFEQRYPNIKVEATFLPIGTAYAQALRTQLQAGNAPDVFYVTAGSGGLQSVLPLAREGYVADLSRRPWAKDHVPENARHLYWIGNRLYAVPINVVPVGVLHQPAVLEQLGIRVPTTMREFLNACRRATAGGKRFLNLAGASVQNSGLFAVVVAGSYVLAKDPQWNQKRLRNRVTFAGTPEWRTALQRIVDMKNAGCFPPGAEGNDNVPATPGFVSGQVASWVLPSSIVGLIKSFNRNASYNFFAMPGDRAADTQVYASPNDAFAVYSRTRVREAANRFVDFWATPQAGGLYAKLTGAASIYQAKKGRHLAWELRGLAPLLKQPKKVHPLMNLEWRNPAVFETLGKGVQGLLTGQRTPDQILRDMDAAWASG